MDLRPSNIMWRRLLPPSSQKIEVRIIDVEDAVPFGYYIRDVSALRGDPRYPLHKKDIREQIPASDLHNNWFLLTVTAWARQTEYTEFTHFMRNKAQVFVGMLPDGS